MHSAGNIKCESVGLMRRLLNGRLWPAVPPVGLSVVDIDRCGGSAHAGALHARSQWQVCIVQLADCDMSWQDLQTKMMMQMPLPHELVLAWNAGSL